MVRTSWVFRLEVISIEDNATDAVAKKIIDALHDVDLKVALGEIDEPIIILKKEGN